jgi:hypothetical protein
MGFIRVSDLIRFAITKLAKEEGIDLTNTQEEGTNNGQNN